MKKTEEKFRKDVGEVLDNIFGEENVIRDANIGHNSKRVGGIAADQLRSIIERVEKLTEEKQAIQGDINEVYAESRSNGFDVRALREIIKIRKMDASEREEKEAVLDTYLHALGMTNE